MMKPISFDLYPEPTGTKPDSIDYSAHDRDAPFGWHEDPQSDVVSTQQAKLRAEASRYREIGNVVAETETDEVRTKDSDSWSTSTDVMASQGGERDGKPDEFEERLDLAIWEDDDAPEETAVGACSSGFDSFDDGGPHGPGDDETSDNIDGDEPNEHQPEPSRPTIDIPNSSFGLPPDDWGLPPDSTLHLTIRTIEDRMKEMNDNNREPKHIPLDNVRLENIEQPTFGNPNQPSDASKRFADLVRGLGQNELVLCADQYTSMVESGLPPAAEFQEIAALGVGRQRSRHGVIFGQMDVETDRDAPITTFVAMKPYDLREKSSNFGARADRAVAHDWAINQHLRSMSTSSAYEPLGVWRDEDSYFVPGLITRYNERSLSLDNLLSDVVLDEHGEIDPVTQLRARQALRLGHFGLGIAHGIHVIIGDASPQNIATDGSHIIFPDTTTMQPFTTTQRINEARAEGDMIDFVSGALHPKVTSERMRTLTGESFKESEFRLELYRSYLAGIALGAQRAGHPTTGDVVVPQTTHEQIIDRFVQKYVPAA